MAGEVEKRTAKQIRDNDWPCQEDNPYRYGRILRLCRTAGLAPT